MILIRPLERPEEVARVVALEIEVWAMDPGGAVPDHLLRALAHTGGLVMGALDGEQIVGCVVAFPAKMDGEWILWSHMTGVHPAYQGREIGTRLKWGQRQWALERGYHKIGWTYDPLQRGNAHFNLRRLGAWAQHYHVDFYGHMSDGINAGLESDRLQITWELLSARTIESAEGRTIPLDDEAAPFLLRSDSGAPLLDLPPQWSETRCRIEIPDSISALKKDQIALAREWQLALRQAMQTSFAAGYAAVDFVSAGSRGWYVLEKSSYPTVTRTR